MPTFPQFLPSLALALDVFDQRIAADPTIVRRDPSARVGVAGDLLIGVGASAPSDAICLNNKTATGSPTSVTRLVQHAPAPLVTAWAEALGGPVDPVAVLSSVRLVVEDAGPDSCFALVLFLARLAGVPPEQLPDNWIAYIDAWEQGASPANPLTAHGTLHNALVHFSIQATPAAAWQSGLRLLHEVLANGLSPNSIPPDMGGPWLVKARAALTYDAQAYEENWRHAQCVQLSVPLAGFPDRRRLIDACLFEETIPVGAMRDFARADRTRSALRGGFPLLAIHRPGIVGSGNDITISVDPAAMLDLRALWRALEAEEDARWAGARPCDQPRALGGYPDGRREDGTPSPTQPWYHSPDFTLLGAPKALADGRPGSRLGWDEVLEILWRLFEPLQDARFHLGLAAAGGHASGSGRPLHDCAPEAMLAAPAPERPAHRDARVHAMPDALPEPRLIVARWDRADNAAPAFRITPTLGRRMAHCLARPPGNHAPIRLTDLPPEGSWDAFDLPGGLAVIGGDGAFLLDGGLAQRPPLADLAAVFHAAAHTLREVRTSGARIVRLLNDTHAFLNGETGDTAEALLAELAWWQIRIARDEHARQAAMLSPLQQRFRAALLARWGIAGWSVATARYIEDIKQALANHTNQEINRRVAFLQGYGLPIAAGASLFGFVFAGLSPGLDFKLGGMHWKGLVLYMALVAAGCVAMRIVSALSEGRAKRQLRNSGRR